MASDRPQKKVAILLILIFQGCKLAADVARDEQFPEHPGGLTSVVEPRESQRESVPMALNLDHAYDPHLLLLPRPGYSILRNLHLLTYSYILFFFPYILNKHVMKELLLKAKRLCRILFWLLPQTYLCAFSILIFLEETLGGRI